MADDRDGLMVKVRADTSGFARDVDVMRATLEGPLVAGAARAGRAMESSIERFVRTGKFGFDDLKRTALTALTEIVAAQARSVARDIGGGSAGLLSGLLNGVGTLLGLPGRATGGPVTGGRGYVVGERGPEVFVPSGSGRVEPAVSAARGPVSITVNVAAAREASPEFMRKTGAQVARSVRAALLRVG